MTAEYDRYFADVAKKQAGNEYVTTHCRRYAMSLDWISGELGLVKSVLEIGSQNPFTGGMATFFPGLQIEHTHPADLRTVFTDKRDHYDFLVNMEVIEHINDLDIKDTFHLESYVGDGVLNFVNTCYACLKPGGKMFLSTPNLSSMGTLWRTMLGWNPFSYHYHVRELSMNGLCALLAAAGFKIVRHETVDCYIDDRVPPHIAEKILALLKDCGCQVSGRAAVQFLMALKPA